MDEKEKLERLERLERKAFIEEHIKTCNAKRVKKFGKDSPLKTLRSADYAKRSCAKTIWRLKKKKSKDLIT